MSDLAGCLPMPVLPMRPYAVSLQGYLSQDDEQVPGRHGAVAAAEDAVAADCGFSLSVI